MLLCCAWQVFLKEHSRGLYSAFLRWLVEDTPLLLLRFCQGLMYAVVVHQWMGYQGGGEPLAVSTCAITTMWSCANEVFAL